MPFSRSDYVMAVRAFGVERLMDCFEREGAAAGHRERLKEEQLKASPTLNRIAGRPEQPSPRTIQAGSLMFCCHRLNGTHVLLAQVCCSFEACQPCSIRITISTPKLASPKLRTPKSRLGLCFAHLIHVSKQTVQDCSATNELFTP
jgi:hypothetical protein